MNHLSIGILLLLISIHDVSSEVVPLEDKDKSKLMSDINALRSEEAIRSKIGNMNELTWSPDLEKVVSGLNCETVKDELKEPNSYYAFPVKQRTDLTAYFSREQKPNGTGSSCNYRCLTLLNPVQTSFACVGLEPPGCGDVAAICAIGPKDGQFKGDDIDGEPGSKCPSDRTAETGLCKVATPTGSGSSGDSKDSEEEKSSKIANSHMDIICVSILLVFMLFQ